MKLTFRKILYFLTTLSIFYSPLAYALDDAIIAIVNDQMITLKELKEYVHSTYVSLVAEGLSDAQLKDAMKDLEVNGINKLIEDNLMLSKVNNIGMEVREKIVDDKLETIKKNYGSEQAFLEAIINNGVTLTELRNKIRDQMKISFLVEHEVRSKIFVNPQEVTDYYNQNIDQFKKKERVFLESIFISLEQGEKHAEEKAKEAQELLQSGKDFQEVMQQFSEGESVGTIERGQLLPEIENTVFQLNDNQISAPVKVQSGIYIFKLTGKKPEETAELSEVKESIYNMLFQKKFKDRFNNWLTKLKKNAYIEIKK